MSTSGFISKAACRGYRPARFASHKGRQRPHLIARLAKDRTTARFVVAPHGYGKTSLAIDYAETMFAWAHVFWISAQSPCFIRDLDAGIIASACLGIDAEAKLVVIDDLPQLDAQRVDVLSREIDALLSHGCEVVVACVPSCDLLGSAQLDRMRIGAVDLLLNDEELDASRSEEERMRRSAEHVPAAERVPVLSWDPSPASAASFAAGCFGEDLPADLLLAACSAFALRRGSIADLAGIGPADSRLMADASEDYPHLGFDAETGSFEAPLIDAEILARAAKPRMEALVGRSQFPSRGELAEAWAGILLARRVQADRACDLMRAFCTAKRRASWLVSHARGLVRCGCFHAMARLIGSLDRSPYDSKERVLAVDALCRRMLGDDEGAVRRAKRCAFEPSFPRDAAIVGLLLVVRLGPGELKAKAASLLAERAASLAESGSDAMAWHDALVVAWSSREGGVVQLGATWKALHDAQADDDVQCLVASWLFADVGELWGDSLALSGDVLRDAERFVRSRLSDGDSLHVDFLAASAGLSMEAAHAKGMPYFEGPLPASVLLGLRRAEMAVMVQRRAYDQGKRSERAKRAAVMADGSPYRGRNVPAAPAERYAVPTLELKMFGRLDIAIGGVPLDPGLIARKQARILLMMLVANRGRDISRDAVAQVMWPNRDVQGARKNFYTAWSQLRRALTLPDGTCPYLVRHQYGCHLDERYVRSDIARLDDICRELLFGRFDLDEWLEIYNEIDRDFSGDLMPVEEENPLITRVRDERRNRLIDALVAASLRLIEAGYAQWGIWFARAAIEREGTREDAYVALMRAQVAHDQRTAAMMTYLNCRRVLAEELGIDPSPEMTALYESLLGS